MIREQIINKTWLICADYSGTELTAVEVCELAGLMKVGYAPDFIRCYLWEPDTLKPLGDVLEKNKMPYLVRVKDSAELNETASYQPDDHIGFAYIRLADGAYTVTVATTSCQYRGKHNYGPHSGLAYSYHYCWWTNIPVYIIVPPVVGIKISEKCTGSPAVFH